MAKNWFHIDNFYLIKFHLCLYTIIKCCKDYGFQSNMQTAYSVTKIILHKNNVPIDFTTLICNLSLKKACWNDHNNPKHLSF